MLWGFTRIRGFVSVSSWTDHQHKDETISVILFDNLFRSTGTWLERGRERLQSHHHPVIVWGSIILPEAGDLLMFFPFLGTSMALPMW